MTSFNIVKLILISAFLAITTRATLQNIQTIEIDINDHDHIPFEGKIENFVSLFCHLIDANKIAMMFDWALNEQTKNLKILPDDVDHEINCFIERYKDDIFKKCKNKFSTFDFDLYTKEIDLNAFNESKGVHEYSKPEKKFYQSFTNLIISMNLMYEYMVMCTSGCVRNNMGTVMHLRNFDLKDKNILVDLVYKARYYRTNDVDGEKEFLYDAIMFAGISGVFSAHKPGAFSITINSIHENANDFKIARFLLFPEQAEGLTATSMLIREVMKKADTYEDAVRLVKEAKVVTSAYFTICGVQGNEGVVIYKKGAQLTKKFKKHISKIEMKEIAMAIPSVLKKLQYVKIPIHKAKTETSTLGDIAKELNDEKNSKLFTKSTQPKMVESFLKIMKKHEEEGGIDTGSLEAFEVVDSLEYKNFIVIGNTYETEIKDDGTVHVSTKEQRIIDAEAKLEDVFKAEKETGSAIQPEEILNLLTEAPFFHPLTVYSTIMIPSEPQICQEIESPDAGSKFCVLRPNIDYVNGMMVGKPEKKKLDCTIQLI